MKYLWMIIGFLLLCSPAFTQDFIVTSDEYIVVSGNVSDTLGRTRLTPDSIRIVVTDSAGTELSDAWFEAADAQAVLNGDIITFFDQWDDINGAASVGIFSLVVTFASDAQGNIDVFSNYNYTIRGVTVGVEQTFNEVGDALDTLQNQDNWVATSVNQTLIIDTVNGIMDSTQLQDNWVAKEASLYDPATDSVIIDGSSLAATTNAITATTMATDVIGSDELAASAVDEIVDSTWDEVLTGATHNVTNSAGRRLRDVSHIIIAEGTAQRGTSLGIVLASITSFADGVINGNIITLIEGTGVGQSRYIHDFTGATDSITLHDGDEWTTTPDNTSKYIINPAAEVSVIHVSDSAKVDIADAVWDALVADHSTTLTYGDTLPEMLRLIQDTTESQDDWIGTRAGVDSLKTNIIAAAGNVVDSVSNSNVQFKTDLSNAVNDHYNDQILIFTSGVNAGQSRRVLDYFGTPKYIFVSSLFEAEPTAGDDFVILFNTANVKVSAMEANVITAGVIAGNAIGAEELATDAVDEIWEYDTSLFDVAAGVGTMLKADLDSLKTNIIAAAGDIVDSSTNSASAFKTNLSNNVDDHYNNQFMIFTSGTNAGQGRRVLDYDGGRKYLTVIPAFEVEPTAGDDLAILFISTKVSVSDIDANAITAASIAIDAFDADAFATDAIDEFWEFDTANFDAAAGVGTAIKNIQDTTDAQGSAGAGAISDADMVSIADTVWKKAFATAWTAGSIGDSLTTSSYVQGFDPTTDSVIVDGSSLAATTAAITATTIATDAIGSPELALTAVKEIWNIAFTTGFTAGSMGDSLSNSAYVQGSAAGVDSTLISNLLHRVVWGTAVGSGSDSSTATQRDIGALLADIITAAVMATDAIDEFWEFDTANFDAAAGVGTAIKNIQDTTDSQGSTGGLDTLSDTYRNALLGLIADSNWQSTLADRDGVAGSFGDSAKYWKGIKDGGTGTDTLQIRAVDTSGTDNSVANVTIVAVSPGGSVVARGTTDDNGLVLFELDAGVVYSITGVGPNFQQWNNPTSMTNTAGYNPTSDTLFGWSISTAVPAATKTAAVLVILKDASGAPAEGVNVSAYLLRSNLTDSSGAGVVNIPQNIKTDATGVATFTCRWSSYLIPATKWRFQAHVPGSGGIRRDYTVPRVIIDTLNLAD